MKWLIVAIVVLVVILVWQLLRKRHGIAMVQVRVGFDGHRGYQVAVEELQPTSRSAEHVRLLLGLAAGLLYWIERKVQQPAMFQKELLDNLEAIANLPLTPGEDLLGLTGQGIEVAEVDKLTCSQLLTATLHYQNLAYRFVNLRRIKSTDVQSLISCWVAMASLSLAKWDQKIVDRFVGALSALVEIYRGNSGPLTLQTVIHYPNRAFLQYMTGANTGQ